MNVVRVALLSVKCSCFVSDWAAEESFLCACIFPALRTSHSQKFVFAPSGNAQTKTFIIEITACIFFLVVLWCITVEKRSHVLFPLLQPLLQTVYNSLLVSLHMSHMTCWQTLVSAVGLWLLHSFMVQIWQIILLPHHFIAAAWFYRSTDLCMATCRTCITMHFLVLTVCTV